MNNLNIQEVNDLPQQQVAAGAINNAYVDNNAGGQSPDQNIGTMWYDFNWKTEAWTEIPKESVNIFNIIQYQD